MSLSPGLTNEAIHVVRLDVDADLPDNASPVQLKEEVESALGLSVLKVQLSELASEIERQASDGVSIWGPLQMLSLGMGLSM
mmetsp:Transcript_20940/g.31589  ORF Transcript_20940/g.31589 Transcript_20940/m.31589 type:complete len:82 (+) Transcript_20940:3-248(+)